MRAITLFTLTHLMNGLQEFKCKCGYSGIAPERMIKAVITAHRMEVFPLVRVRLAGE